MYNKTFLTIKMLYALFNYYKDDKCEYDEC